MIYYVTIGLCILTIVIHFTLFFKRKTNPGIKMQATERKLLKDILSVPFENATVNSVAEEICFFISSRYNFSYVTILINEEDTLKVLASTNHDKHVQQVKRYVLDIISNHGNKYIESSRTSLLYPSASEKDIKSVYLIPLYIGNDYFGQILIEDKKLDQIKGYEHDLFSLIADNIALVLSNMMFTQKNKDMAYMDSLTGVYNKRYMLQYLASHTKACRSRRRTYSLGIIDIDFFKKFNDRYGHQHGDIVLKKVAQSVQSQIGANDVLFRFGGEEFVILFDSDSKEKAENKLNVIRLTIENLEIKSEDTDEITPVTLSGGIAQYPLHSEDYNQVLSLADKALYYSKDHGRNQVTTFNNTVSEFEALEVNS